jgi:LmbE family N-acetylglucosaminyl deacetylase
MIKLRKDFNPEVVVLPSMQDKHQDHEVISQEGFRAFKRCSILGYEQLWNLKTFTPNFFIKLDLKHIETKVSMINCYKSQSERQYCKNGFFKSLANVRGTQCGVEYAEAFELIRGIL